MAYVAFKPNDIKKIFKQIIIFYLTSFVFGGVALNLIYFLRPENINIKNLYIIISLKNPGLQVQVGTGGFTSRRSILP